MHRPRKAISRPGGSALVRSVLWCHLALPAGLANLDGCDGSSPRTSNGCSVPAQESGSIGSGSDDDSHGSCASGTCSIRRQQPDQGPPYEDRTGRQFQLLNHTEIRSFRPDCLAELADADDADWMQTRPGGTMQPVDWCSSGGKCRPCRRPAKSVLRSQ